MKVIKSEVLKQVVEHSGYKITQEQVKECLKAIKKVIVFNAQSGYGTKLNPVGNVTVKICKPKLTCNNLKPKYGDKKVLEETNPLSKFHYVARFRVAKKICTEINKISIDKVNV